MREDKRRCSSCADTSLRQACPAWLAGEIPSKGKSLVRQTISIRGPRARRCRAGGRGARGGIPPPPSPSGMGTPKPVVCSSCLICMLSVALLSLLVFDCCLGGTPKLISTPDSQGSPREGRNTESRRRTEDRLAAGMGGWRSFSDCWWDASDQVPLR